MLKINLKISKMRTITLLILVSIVASAEVQFTKSISATLPKCTFSQYYDTTAFNCRNCPDGQVASSSGLACSCPAGSAATTATAYDFMKECSVCPGGQAPNKGGTHCGTCGGGMNNC